MTVERRNPIPTGRYWVDCQGNMAVTQFDIWKRTYSGSIHIEDAEEDLQANPPHAFYIFSLSKPTARWEYADNGLGYPNTAGSDVHSKADAYAVPTVETPNLLDFLNNSSTLVLIGLALFLLTRKGSKS